MVNFELSEEMWNDVVNMSQAWEKESLTGIEPKTFRTRVIHTYIIQMRISTLLILAVLRTRVTCEPCICPSWPWVSSVASASDQGVEGHQFLLGTQIFYLSHPCDILITSFLISSLSLRFTIFLFITHVIISTLLILAVWRTLFNHTWTLYMAQLTMNP